MNNAYGRPPRRHVQQPGRRLRGCDRDCGRGRGGVGERRARPVAQGGAGQRRCLGHQHRVHVRHGEPGSAGLRPIRHEQPAALWRRQGALLQYTRYAAVHLAPEGIRVNAISPGAFPPDAAQQRDPAFAAALTPEGSARPPGQARGPRWRR
ncbi:MAG: SDR family oxidoreductase, partial [Rhodospirillaceae bacterium]|nr:SDR family oxidoreductase [Rhodospirillaceae bacterium]